MEVRGASDAPRCLHTTYYILHMQPSRSRGQGLFFCILQMRPSPSASAETRNQAPIQQKAERRPPVAERARQITPQGAGSTCRCGGGLRSQGAGAARIWYTRSARSARAPWPSRPSPHDLPPFLQLGEGQRASHLQFERPTAPRSYVTLHTTPACRANRKRRRRRRVIDLLA
jgi:hypothetical protein